MVAFYAPELGIMPECCLVFVALWFASIQKFIYLRVFTQTKVCLILWTLKTGRKKL